MKLYPILFEVFVHQPRDLNLFISNLVKEIRKNPWMINSYDYFFKEINCWIFHKISEEHDVRDDIEHLLSVENKIGRAHV